MKHTDAQCTRIPAIFYEFDDDDSHIINSLLEILLAVSKQALDKNSSRWEETNEYQVPWYEIARMAVLYQFVRKAVLTSCGIPSRITSNQVTPGAHPWYFMYFRGKKGGKKTKTKRVLKIFQRNENRKEGEM